MGWSSQEYDTAPREFITTAEVYIEEVEKVRKEEEEKWKRQQNYKSS